MMTQISTKNNTSHHPLRQLGRSQKKGTRLLLLYLQPANNSRNYFSFRSVALIQFSALHRNGFYLAVF